MGYAFLKDGTRMDYKEYIETHPHWQKVRKARFDFDGGKCAICHKNLEGKQYQTHHLDYKRLGNEYLTDVITLCPDCHDLFHINWTRQNYWQRKESDHWEVFSLGHTARLCATYYKEDRYICKDANAPNLCNQDVDRQYIDEYCRSEPFEIAPLIDANDIQLFVRNKRYEMLFDAESRGLTVEEFLDECYGLKVRGKNPMRRDAGAYFNKHSLQSYHLHYSENENINILMREVEKYEGGCK